MSNGKRVLLVGCSDFDVSQFRNACIEIDCRIKTANTAADAYIQFQRFQPHLTVLDTRLEVDILVDLCKHVKLDHTSRVLIVTELNDLADIEHAVALGPHDLLAKPIDAKECCRRVAFLLRMQDEFRRFA